MVADVTTDSDRDPVLCVLNVAKRRAIRPRHTGHLVDATTRRSTRGARAATDHQANSVRSPLYTPPSPPELVTSVVRAPTPKPTPPPPPHRPASQAKQQPNRGGPRGGRIASAPGRCALSPSASPPSLLSLSLRRSLRMRGACIAAARSHAPLQGELHEANDLLVAVAGGRRQPMLRKEVDHVLHPGSIRRGPGVARLRA